MIAKEVKFGSKEYFLLRELREKELRIPLGKRLISADVRGEGQQFHFGIFNENNALACVVLAPQKGQAVKMRQVCTSEKFQGKGLGKHLLSFVENWARSKNYKEINCHARKTASSFYAKFGYKIQGALFEEIGIPHYYMVKVLE